MESIPLPPRRSRYVCQQCGEVSVKWLGRCPSCEAWNTLVEELDVRESRPRRAAAGARSVPATEASGWEEERRSLGVWELDRVLGGGIVPGALVLVGGEPGVGKSTLLLQVAALYAERCGTVLYVSGEESVGQVAMRARRLGTVHPRLRLLSEARVEVIEEVIAAEEPELVVVDSIQTMLHPDLETGPGSVAQVRECCHFLGRIGKERGIAVFFIGHVTKQGTLAGPKPAGGRPLQHPRGVEAGALRQRDLPGLLHQAAGPLVQDRGVSRQPFGVYAHGLGAPGVGLFARDEQAHLGAGLLEAPQERR